PARELVARISALDPGCPVAVKFGQPPLTGGPVALPRDINLPMKRPMLFSHYKSVALQILKSFGGFRLADFHLVCSLSHRVDNKSIIDAVIAAGDFNVDLSCRCVEVFSTRPYS